MKILLFLFFPSSENGRPFLGLTTERKKLKAIFLLQTCVPQHADRDQHEAHCVPAHRFPSMVPRHVE